MTVLIQSYPAHTLSSPAFSGMNSLGPSYRPSLLAACFFLNPESDRLIAHYWSGYLSTTFVLCPHGAANFTPSILFSASLASLLGYSRV